MNEIKKSFFSTQDLIRTISVPERTDSYSPISHSNVIDFTLEQLDKANLKLSKERYVSAKDGRQAMGFYRIEDGADKEMGIELIWHNSYDKSMSLKWAIGGHVFVCQNGVVSGDIGSFKRKHTGDALIDYSEAVQTYVNKAGDIFRGLIADKDRMKEIEVSKKTSAELLGRLYVEKEIINPTQLNVVKRELLNPSFDYKAEGSLWQLYNHTTVALKDAHPMLHLKQHMEVHEFFKTEFAL